MNLSTVTSFGGPILEQPAHEVKDFHALEVRTAINTMKEALKGLGSFAGLAAPQVNIPLRIFMYQITEERAKIEKEKEAVPFTIVINPLLHPLTDKVVSGWEGCFSLWGLKGNVPRYESVLLTAFDDIGQAIRRIAHNFHARVLQHEYDHLEGILFLKRLPKLYLTENQQEIKACC
jgi:peptide deformylase